MTHLARLASLIYNRALLVHPDTAALVSISLGERFGVAGDVDLGGLVPEASRFRGNASPESGGKYRVEGGIALITVTGELCNRGAWIGASSGLTSYEGVTAQLRAAVADPAVQGIALDLNTPGGEAVGAFEAADAVRSAAAKKPVIAFVDGMAASAGYALASGADRIVVTPSAIVGSIGVVMMHLDQSKRLDKQGVAPTLIFAGAHKVDGHSLGPLPDGVKADLQAEVNRFYGMFVDTVARNRRMSADAVRATEARCFMGAEAVAAGLADEVGTLDTVLSALKQARAAPGFTGATRMTDVSRADHEVAVATARSEGHQAGATAERQRISAIFGLDEAKGREASARHMALSTGMAAEDVRGVLAGLPAAAEAPVAPSRMALAPKPDVAPDAPPEAKSDAGAASWGAAVAAVNKAAASAR